jgi:hypothetical protein
MRHVASLSGGLDSSVMWLFLSGYLPGYRVDGIEAVFTDPRKEDPKTYAMLDALEQVTGVEIARVKGPTWEEALEQHSFFLPFHHARWCTPMFKIHPFVDYLGGDQVVSYIGLRADEPERRGYLGDDGDNVRPRYPLRELGLARADVERIAREVGLPEPAKWSCSCCPFRPHVMWAETIERMPEVAEWCAWVEEEKRRRGGSGYTWVRGYTIRELIDSPVLRSEIRRRYWAKNPHQSQTRWDWDVEFGEMPCLMCQVK